MLFAFCVEALFEKNSIIGKLESTVQWRILMEGKKGPRISYRISTKVSSTLVLVLTITNRCFVIFVVVSVTSVENLSGNQFPQEKSCLSQKRAWSAGGVPRTPVVRYELNERGSVHSKTRVRERNRHRKHKGIPRGKSRHPRRYQKETPRE